jgi:hypoxanthine phosphoribosyltransferase
VSAHGLYPDDIKSVLVSEEQIQARTAELAAEVARDYADNLNGQDLLLVTVLKGAVMFVTDLARAIPLPTQLEFMAVSSYGSSTSSSGVVRILKDLDRDIADRDVLIVEDIIDTGLTLSKILELLRGRNPRSLKVCTLLNKPSRRQTPVTVDYNGFDIEDVFVAGYGIDFAQKYRNLPQLVVVKKL